MIRRLRHKFVMIAMSSLLLVMMAIIGSINVLNYYQMNKRVDGLLQVLSENDGRFPKNMKGGPRPPKPEWEFHFNQETPFRTRYFTVKYDEGGTSSQIDTSHIAAITSQEAQQYGDKALKSIRTKGYMGAYKYLVVEKPFGSLVIFVDCSDQFNTGTTLLLISVAIALISLLVVFILVSALSKRAVRPVIASLEKQKQFITDAGHEIKTPLAIISANAEVLEMTSGENEWTASIRSQIQRLDQLVKDLLTLSKLDEGNRELVHTDFSLSDAVEETATPFMAVAEAMGKRLNVEIQKNITYRGAEPAIRQLVSILADNALKHSGGHGVVRVVLTQSGRGIKLQVSNFVEQDLSGEDMDRWFDRFYRADQSRNQGTGGYGIGLSIAQTIVESHRGKITAKYRENKEVMITVKL